MPLTRKADNGTNTWILDEIRIYINWLSFDSFDSIKIISQKRETHIICILDENRVYINWLSFECFDSIKIITQTRETDNLIVNKRVW